MTTRLKSGRFVGAATSESARRQLMQPVSCWEKVWVVPEQAAPGSNLKVYKWVKTDKKQQFSDDEEAGADEPLAPLPDEPMQDEDEDEDKDQEDTGSRAVTAAPPSRDVSEPVTAQPSIAPSEVGGDSLPPKPHPLSLSFVPTSETQSMVDGDETENPIITEAVAGNENENENESGVGNENENEDVKNDNENENENENENVLNESGADNALDSSLNPLNAAMDSIDMKQFDTSVEGFDAAAVADQAMQDAMENGMPNLLGS